MVTSTSRYLPFVRALWSTPCQGEQPGVGRGENRDGNRDGNSEGRPACMEREHPQAGRAAGYGEKKEYVGGGCVGVPGVLRKGGC